MSYKHIRVKRQKAYIKISTVLIKIIIIWKQNREGTLFSVITNTNDRLACSARKVFINLSNGMYASYLVCLPLLFMNQLHKTSYFF